MATLGVAAAAAAAGIAAWMALRASERLVRSQRVVGAAGHLAERAVAAGKARGNRDARWGWPVAAAAVALLTAGLAVDAVAGILLAPIAASATRGAGAWRRRRYRQALERQVPELARSLASALTGGGTLRGAIAEVSAAMEGPAGAELRRVALALALGAPTDGALEELRRRSGSGGMAILVAAMDAHRRVGGDLAALLREIAGAAAERFELLGEARTASAQARFTGKVVVAMPVVGALVAEAASPGLAAGVAGSFLGIWLLVVAGVMQAAGAVVIRRIARVDPT